MAIKYRNMEIIDEDKKKKQQVPASVPSQQGAASAGSAVNTTPSRESEKVSSPATTPAATKNNAFAPSASVTAANNYLQQIRDGGYNRQWSKTLDSLVNEYMGRGAFEYDPQSDAMWQQAKSEGLRQGQLAMRDATAQAAALSGGYGNSYAATVGNQVYQQAVADTMALQPQYIQAAYERYKEGGDELLQRASLAESMDDAAWNRYMTELGLAQDEADRLYQREYAEFNDQWSRDYKTERDAVEDQRYADSIAYEKERDRIADEQFWTQFGYGQEQDRLDREQKAKDSAYEKLVSLITGTGYKANADELKAAGMSRGEAKAYEEYFNNQSAVTEEEDDYVPYVRTGKVDDYGYEVYNYGGKEVSFGKGTNPVTGTVNLDVENGTFKNGPSYQPNNIGGEKLKATKYTGAINGGEQTLYTLPDDNDTYYIWDAKLNKYRVWEDPVE